MSTTTMKPATIEDARAVALDALESAGGCFGDLGRGCDRSDIIDLIDSATLLTALRDLEDEADVRLGRLPTLGDLSAHSLGLLRGCVAFVLKDTGRFLAGNEQPGEEEALAAPVHRRRLGVFEAAERVRESIGC